MNRSNCNIMQKAVHPHASGEHDTTTLPPSLTDGSSPREWGTFHQLELQLADARFIPTRVGNIKHQTRGTYALTVHPHASGEHFHNMK